VNGTNASWPPHRQAERWQNLNQQSGILADGAGARITIGTSTVAANGTGFARTNGGAIQSHGNNNVDDNTVAGTPSGTPNPM
jgi:hypothetical protein